MGGQMSREQCCEAVWDLHYHEDAGARWELCQSLGKLDEFAEEFASIKQAYDARVAGAIAAGVGAAFTAGATAGLCAGETAKAAAIQCDFLAFCISVGVDQGTFERPDPEDTEEIIDPNDIEDIALWETCKRMMKEEKLAAEYAVVKAIHDCWVTKVISISVAAAAGGGGDDLVDLGLSVADLPEFCEVLSQIKEVISTVEDAQKVADTPFPLLRNYIQLAMQQRKARIG